MKRKVRSRLIAEGALQPKKRVKTVADKKREEQQKEIPAEQKVIFSDELEAKKPKWVNRQRVLIFATRGITFRDRHLMLNLRSLLPHSKKDVKLDTRGKETFEDANDIAKMKNCNKCILFVNKKRKDLYMWMSDVESGPSFKFFVESLTSMEELKMIGNCLKGSRPMLSFDPQFDHTPYFSLCKEMFIQTFGTPNHHPKSQPFFDHLFNFSILDDKIWFRNYQIVGKNESLVEIGPRFVLSLINVFEGSFAGRVLYSNPKFVNPNMRRRLLRLQNVSKYRNKVIHAEGVESRRAKGAAYADQDTLADEMEYIPTARKDGIQKLFKQLDNCLKRGESKDVQEAVIDDDDDIEGDDE